MVSKTARVTGEVDVGKRVSEREEVIHDTVRKTTVEVEDIDGASKPGRSALTSTGTTTGSVRSTGPAGSPNRDPLTGEQGAHPIGTGLGAAAGGVAAGAAVGTVAGPIGTVVGAAVGAVTGGLAGKGAAEAVDPTIPDGKARPNKPV